MWKSFGRKQVLRGIDLALAKGTILAVMGGSGTGKTVLLRIASGLIYPDSGAVSLFGTRIDRMTEEAMLPVRRRSGFVFQGAALFDSLSVFENVAYPLREHTRMPLREITERVHHFLDPGRPARHRRADARRAERRHAQAGGHRARPRRWSRRWCSSTSPPPASTPPTRGWWPSSSPSSAPASATPRSW